jgi:hypothetical protein
MNVLIVLNSVATLVILALIAKPYFQPKPRAITREGFEKAVAAAATSLALAEEFLAIEKAARVPKPIHHPKLTGPTTAKVTSTIGYWRTKGDENAEPFLAAWYERDTTYVENNATTFSPEDAASPGESTVIPADTYVDLIGRRVVGSVFRTRYEPAPAVMEVRRLRPKAAPLRSSTLVAGTPRLRRGETESILTPEEERRLAEEFELVPNPPSMKREFIARNLEEPGSDLPIPPDLG